MKTIIKILLMLAMVLTVSCSDMYNDIADDMGVEYEYSMVVVNGSTQNRVSYIDLDEAGTPSPVNQVQLTYQVSFAAATPSGEYVYVVSNAATAKTITTLRAGGKEMLELLPGTTAITTNNADDPDKIIIDPKGKFLYIYSSYSSNVAKIFIFGINDDGSLTKLDEVDLGELTFNNLIISPSGEYLFLIHEDALFSASMISMYRIGSDGKLTLVFAENDDSNYYKPLDIKVHPNGKYIYISVYDDSTSNSYLYRYTITDTGLTNKTKVVTISDASPGEYSGLIEIHPSGKYLYAASPVSKKLFDYAINDDGSLTAITTAGIDLTSSDYSDSIINPEGNYMYLSNSNSTITRISINKDGSLGTKEDYVWNATKPTPYTNFTSSAMGLALIRKKK